MPEGSLKLKAQIMCGGETAMGPGKADLLGAIDREGSISAAGRALGMSYRRCWQLVDTMNRCWAERVVETAIGGGRERGARLTPLGQQLLTAYRGLEATLASAAERDLGWFTTALRAESIPASGHRVLNK
ncbi:winged helix-turn-helix domain-containing protein [Glacieibacterium megasporae]|uniref:winged helix-turn-helix domain-containing protein n=1 Tax=Glacieibacterium megasporae TaxID=2835787 RepID=UPI001C1DE9E5|nr:LysR family transcriptional regulator [Polymorphobacter megasporae]UAJ12882.1 LysR family transcriptional regulator [Polymorphobacter megasporae]